MDNIISEVSSTQFFSGTTDMWSSRTTEPYMSYTIHYINNNWELKNKCLQTMYFPEDHTGENIAEGLKNTLSTFNLREENQTCITTDNGSNIISAARINNWIRLQCFGHRLHLAINYGLNDTAIKEKVSRAKAVCKKVVAAFSYSWKRRKAFHKYQLEEGLPSHELISECDTRWGSMQAMIARFLEQEKAVTKALVDDRKSSHLIPKWQDVAVLEAINKALEPLVEFTDALSGDTYVSVSSVKPILQLFNKDILAAKEDDVQLTKDIKSKILEYMNSKYNEEVFSEILNKATFLDPRFKEKHFSAEELTELRDKLMEDFLQIPIINPSDVDDVAEDNPDQTRTTSDPSTSACIQEAPRKKRKLGRLLKERESLQLGDQSLPELSIKQLFDQELNCYLAHPKLDLEADPLLWWKANCFSLPKLATLAKKYLCVPATSSPSERVFSLSGNIVNCKRTALNPTKVNMLTVLE